MSDALRVAADMLREAGHDAEARWLDQGAALCLVIAGAGQESCLDVTCQARFRGTAMHSYRCQAMEALWRVAPYHPVVFDWIERARRQALGLGIIASTPAGLMHQLQQMADAGLLPVGEPWVLEQRQTLSTTPAARMQQVLAMAESGLLPHAATRVLLDYPANSRPPEEE